MENFKLHIEKKNFNTGFYSYAFTYEKGAK